MRAGGGVAREVQALLNAQAALEHTRLWHCTKWWRRSLLRRKLYSSGDELPGITKYSSGDTTGGEAKDTRWLPGGGGEVECAN